MSETAFICPLCGGKLVLDEKTARCPKGHCYDRAKQGYINLLMGQSPSKHGDSKEMLRARREFLNGGYYEPLRERVAGIVGGLAPDGALLDSGCGEGYYTEAAAKAAGVTGGAEIYGIDISADAVKMAASRKSGVLYAVASVYRLPLESASLSGIISVFSPFAGDEFLRTLKPGGFCIEVIPLEKHLWELKRLVYDTPYENRPDDAEREGFTRLAFERVDSTFTLDSAALKSLFEMTPYFRKTSEKDAAKLDSVSTLDLTSSFGIIVYRKK